MTSEAVYDLCIIGAGLFGSAAARHASANSDLKICLIGPGEPTTCDSSEREIFGAHYDEGRIVRNLDDHPARIVLCRNSIRRFKEMEKQSGIDFYSPVGCLFVSTKDGQFLHDIRNAAVISNASVIEISGREELQKRYPFLSLNEDESALLDEEGAGHISPRNLVSLQKKMAGLQSCHIIEDVVNKTRTLLNGLHEVETEKNGSIQTKSLLISTGAYVNLKPIGGVKPLDVIRYAVTAALLNISEEEAKRLRSMPSIIRRIENSSEELGVYILPPIKYPDGQYYIKFGISREYDEITNLKEMKDWYLSDGNKKAIDTHLPFVKEMLPGLKITGMKTITCVVCHSPTGLPYIDQVSPTVTMAVVGNGRGAKFSDEVGRIAASLSTTGTWKSELKQTDFKAIFQ